MAPASRHANHSGTRLARHSVLLALLVACLTLVAAVVAYDK